ncbi:MAG: ABC transporter permease [Lachnospirales bacterium]
MNIFNILLGASAQGLLWAVMAIGVYITYRVLDIADLTCEGCFTLGGGVCCVLITNGVNPFVATLCSLLAGLTAGLVTGLLHTKLKIPALLSGILTMTALWSVNLRVMGKSNIPLLKEKTIISMLESFLQSLGVASTMTKNTAAIIAGFILTLVVILILWWFFKTEIGYALRATGNNQNMIRAQGVNTNTTVILGVMLGNGLIALSSALVSQFNCFADISSGIGTIVIGLASVIIGEVVFGHRNILHSLIAVALGSILYRIIIALVLQLGLKTDDMKLISSILLTIALCFPTIRNIVVNNLKNSLKKGGNTNA